MNSEQILYIMLNQEKSVLSTKVVIFCTAVLYEPTLQVDSNSWVDLIFPGISARTRHPFPYLSKSSFQKPLQSCFGALKSLINALATQQTANVFEPLQMKYSLEHSQGKSLFI